MDTIRHNMIQLYYKNLEQHAKKHKIEIALPHNTDIIEIPVVLEVGTESETIYSDDFVYKKPWNKLNSIHKVIKMKEFVNNLTMDDAEIKKHLKNQLVLMVKEKKLTKKNDVEYDMVNGRIISIPSLQYKNNNYNIDA